MEHITEANMRSFFESLATKFVQLSEQSDRLAQLEKDFAAMREELDHAKGRNESLARDIADTWQLVQSVEKERDEAKHQVELFKADLDQAHHTMEDLRGQLDRLRSERDSLAQLAAQRYEELHQTKRAHSEAQDRLRETQNMLHQTQEQHDKVRSERDDLRNKFDTMRSIFSPPPVIPQGQQESKPVSVSSQSLPEGVTAVSLDNIAEAVGEAQPSSSSDQSQDERPWWDREASHG